MTGALFQGDVIFVPISAEYAGTLVHTDPVELENGRLIIMRGAATGHHHSIFMGTHTYRLADDEGASAAGVLTVDLGAPPAFSETDAKVLLQDSLPRAPKLVSVEAGGLKQMAALYRDPALATQLQQDGLLEDASLCVGFLEVESGTATVTHQEHGSLELPNGLYYVGCQKQMVGSLARRVED